MSGEIKRGIKTLSRLMENRLDEIEALQDKLAAAEARIKELEHRSGDYVHRSALDVEENRRLAAERRVAELEKIREIGGSKFAWPDHGG